MSQILSFDEIVKNAESDDGMVGQMMNALEEARAALDKRYESLMAKFNLKLKETTKEYENYDEVCELGDKINNGFGILEEQQVYEIEPKKHIRLTCDVLKEMEEGLDYFEEVCKMYGEKKDQELAAEYDVLTFYRFHFGKVFSEFNNAWLQAYIEKED